MSPVSTAGPGPSEMSRPTSITWTCCEQVSLLCCPLSGWNPLEWSLWNCRAHSPYNEDKGDYLVTYFIVLSDSLASKESPDCCGIVHSWTCNLMLYVCVEYHPWKGSKRTYYLKKLMLPVTYFHPTQSSSNTKKCFQGKFFPNPFQYDPIA